MKKKDKKFVGKLEVYIDKAKQREKYALERFDILIISLSSGGILMSSNLYDKYPLLDKTIVFYACLFFSIAIGINLLSQVTGYFANNYDIKYTTEEICELEKKDFNLNYKKYDCYKNIYNVITNLFNFISLVGFISGMICLLLFINLIP